MTTNMGKFDRALRILIAAALAVLAFSTGTLESGILFWVALAVAAIFTLTAFVGNCPIYRIIGLKTCRNCG
ncbi:YgaP family membrane protein [Ruegeria meonggei]|uniref:YgaP family membrane protein n=1 Tax=Ruegeria meonggei TaxID=1446476 RepID=UPI00367229AE